MSKKEIIQIAVIIGAFGGAGLVLYNGLFKDNISTVMVGATTSQTVQNQKILPNGSTLDLNGPLFTRNFQFVTANNPAINTTTDIGVDEPNLFTPINVQK